MMALRLIIIIVIMLFSLDALKEREPRQLQFRRLEEATASLI